MPNDTCNTAIDLTGQTSYSVVVNTTAFAASGLTIPCGGSPTGPKSAWWSYTNAAAGNTFISVDTGGSNYFNVVSIWTGVCGSLTSSVCAANTYATKSVQTAISVAPAQTVWIVVTDDDAGAGGSLAISVTIGTATTVIAAGSPFNNHEYVPMYFYNAADGAFLGGTQWPNNGEPFSGAFARSPVTGKWVSGFGADIASLFNLSPSFVQLSAPTVNAPAAGGSPPNWDVGLILFSRTGDLYLVWEGINSNVTHHAMQQLDPAAFTVIQTWIDFNADMLSGDAGLDISSGDFSPDGTIFYYTTAGGTGASQNNIYKLVLATITNTTLATFGTYSGGVNPTGDSFAGGHVLRTTASGNLVVISTHQTTGTLDNATGLVVTSGGTITTSTALTSWGTFVRPEGLALTDSDTKFWISASGSNLLDQYNLAMTRLIHTTMPDAPGGDDREGSGLEVFANGGGTPVPPPTGTIRSQRRLRRFNLPVDGNMNVKIQRLEFLVQSGQGLVSGLGSQPILMCRFSKDGGQTWGAEMQLNTGAMGDYLKRAYVTRGPFGRNLVCEVWDTDPCFSALLDVFVDVLKGSS